MGKSETLFELVEIRAGVHAVVAAPSSAALSNAGIVDLGDRTLVFDTLGTPEAAEALRTAAERITGRTPAYVVNSHAHFDHWCGNQAFAGVATIFAATEARQAMVSYLPGLEATLADPAPLAERRRAFEERLKEESDPRWRATLEPTIARLEQQIRALAETKPVLPHVSFQSELVLSGTSRTAVVRNHGPGHSESDAYLLLPDERVAFLGDLAFSQSQPLLTTGDPAAWSALLRALAECEHDTLVPGHGPLGTRDDLLLQQGYFEALEAMVTRVVEQGGAVESALEQSLPAPFDGWMATDMLRFEQNVRTTFARIAAEPAAPSA